MTLVTVEDVLDDKRLRRSLSDDLARELERGWREAENSRRDSRIRRNGYDLVVSRHGDIDCEIVSFGGFAQWVEDAGELALHVGPTHDPQTGQNVTDILGLDEEGNPVEPAAEAADDDDDDTGDDSGDDDVAATARWTTAGPPLHWPEWSPRRFAEEDATGEAADLTVATGTVVWAYRCDSCGTASSDAADFEPTAATEERRCHCGELAVRTPAVYCESCDTLILLRSTDPEAG